VDLRVVLDFAHRLPGLVQRVAGLGSAGAQQSQDGESTVVAVLRKSQVVVPRGDTVLHAGDEVMVLVTGESEPDVRRILVG
jgi:Trk K+ transport system NAD-binding subunit